MNSFQKLLTVFAPFAFVFGHAAAHPLQAKAPEYAHVFNFESLYANETSDEKLTEGGYLLLGELNCTACHTPPKSWESRLAAKPGPDLTGVASRLDATSLQEMVRNPQTFKHGTQMPNLFNDGAADDEKVKALTTFLGSLQKKVKSYPAGNPDHGKDLYHKVGCVACHAPAADYRPVKVSVGVEMEKPKLASVPLTLAGYYEVNALTSFLLDPLSHRPSGRMPDMRLTEKEAADIAAYLHEGLKESPKQGVNTASADEVKTGRQIFAQMNCVACHSGVIPEAKVTAVPTLVSLKVDHGCLSDKQESGVPHYTLNTQQKKALTLALAAIKKGDAPAETPAQRVDWQMTRLNCYSCHDRQGKGGPEDARALYFGSNDGSAESLGELAHIPPKLGNVGRKLTTEWLKRVLWGKGGSVRPYMDTRMPNFGRAQTEMFVNLLPKADERTEPVTIDVSGLQRHQRAETGRKLIGSTGLACVACHGLKERKSLGPPVIRLTNTVARLQPEYFKELLLNPQATQPGTMMPPMFMGRKKADQEIESLWTYLRELEGQPLPEGLLSTEDFELKPEKVGKPIIFRSFIEGAGSHAIGVGFPQGLHATFDAVQVRWTQVWKGRFLDAMSNWQSREMKPITPLGTDLKVLPEESGAREFAGYRLDKAGVPTFLYHVNGQIVEDTLRPTQDGKAFEHEIKVNGESKKEVLSW